MARPPRMKLDDLTTYMVESWNQLWFERFAELETKEELFNALDVMCCLRGSNKMEEEIACARFHRTLEEMRRVNGNLPF